MMLTEKLRKKLGRTQADTVVPLSKGFLLESACKNYHGIIAAGAALGLSALLLSFFCWPLWQQREQTLEEKELTERRAARTQAFANRFHARADEYLLAYADLKSRLETARQELPWAAQLDQNAVLEHCQRLAAEQGLQVGALQADGEIALKNNALRIYKIKLNLSGDYFAMLSFLRGLESGAVGSCRLANFRLASVPKGALLLEGTLFVYARSEANKAAAKG